MSFQDKSIQCSDCGSSFTHSAKDQEFYQSKGYTNEPKRCYSCRQSKKSERYGNSNYGYQRKTFTATCSDCGRDAELPFEPRGDKPVYCRDCFRKVRSHF